MGRTETEAEKGAPIENAGIKLTDDELNEVAGGKWDRPFGESGRLWCPTDYDERLAEANKGMNGPQPTSHCYDAN